MYVAATRARRTLYLSGAPRSRADGSVAPEARTLLGCLWPVLGERFASAEPRASPAGAAAPIPPPRAVTLRRLREGWRPPELPPATPLPHLPLGRASLDPREFSWVGETQRHVGTVVHAFLARLADSAPLPTPEALEGAREAVARQLERAGALESLGGGERGGVREDRKSTRLNSSHLVISYAVFCLKKKNTVKSYVTQQRAPTGRLIPIRHCTETPPVASPPLPTNRLRNGSGRDYFAATTEILRRTL